MENIDRSFGINAGKIWGALNSNKILTKTQLKKETKLKENELSQAIGWLSRENKIKKDGEFYSLDQTNLSEKIENSAKIISKFFENGKINIDKLENLIKMDEESYNFGLGWLAREGKLKNDIITNNSEENIKKLEIYNLTNKINSLNNDIEIRDQIIKQITEQLTSNQLNTIKETEIYDKIKIEIEQKNSEILMQKNELNSKKIKIEDLKKELNSLNSNIETRNIIIKQITDQLTEKQTQFIEKSSTIKKLKSDLIQNKNLIKIANEKLTNRINMFSDIQNELENEKIESNDSDGTLFSKSDSIFSKNQNEININKEINGFKRENIICEPEEINHSTLKNKKNQIEE